MNKENFQELEEIKKRYLKRESLPRDLYNPAAPWMYMIEQERERILLNLLWKKKMNPLSDKTLFEIGCGNGNNIFQFIRWGFMPENISANELLDDRIKILQERLPEKVAILKGNVLDLTIPPESFDIVFQSMVFSSILDDDFRLKLAQKMLSWVKKGGAILWYDFIYNNPNNKDIRKISRKEIKRLFPGTRFTFKRITLAPPIARKVSKITPHLYTLINSLRFLRSHILCFIEKTE